MKYESLKECYEKSLLNENQEKPSIIKNNKKGNKKRAAIIAVLIMLALSAVGGLVYGLLYKFGKNKNNDNKNITKTESTTDITTLDLADLGDELDFKDEKEQKKSQYGNTTGKADLDKIVEKNGKTYVDQNSANRTNEVGKTTTDTKNNTLVVKPNGTVVEKNEGYEVKDESGNLIESGNNVENMADNYITLDKYYYYKDGSLAFRKGEQVDKDEFNSLKHLLITDLKDVIDVEEETTTKTEEIITPTIPSTDLSNTNGTYVDIYGNTWINYEAYVNGMLDLDGVYTEADGILRYDANINENTQKQLVK